MKISSRLFVLLFVMIALSVGNAFGLFVNWRNEAINGEPDPMELVLRMIAGLVLFGVAGTVFAILVMRR